MRTARKNPRARASCFTRIDDVASHGCRRHRIGRAEIDICIGRAHAAPKIAIGGGNAGISVASKLLLQDKSLKIALIDPADKHYYQPAWTLVGGGAFNIQDRDGQSKLSSEKRASVYVLRSKNKSHL